MCAKITTSSSAAILLVLLIAAGESVASAEDKGVSPLLSGETTRGLALGTGERAGAVSTSGVVYNPASLPLSRLYHVEGAFGYEPQLRRYTGNASIADSTTPIAAGVFVSWMSGDGHTGYSGFDTRLSLGAGLSDAIGIGVSGRYIFVDSDAKDAGPLAKGFTLDASLRVTPVTGLNIAAYGYNLIDLDSPYAPRQLGGGVSITPFSALSFGGDCLVDISTYDKPQFFAGGGVEYLSAGAVPLRVGYAFDTGRQVHLITAGLGYVDERLGLDVSLRQGIHGNNDTTLLAAFRYFVR